MPFLTANKIHNGQGWLPEGTVIEVSDNGTILSVQSGPNEEAVFYEGVLAPGFVNVHCHLELSHMKGVVGEHTGLIPFLKNIPQHRNDFTDEQKKAARFAGYNELYRNGVVAVGDIANTTDTIDVRAIGAMHCHTFVEAIGFGDVHAPKAFEYALQTYGTFKAQDSAFKELKQSIVPHAPYSVSETLFRKINSHSFGSTIAIHNQESRDEDRFFKSKKGAIPDLLHSLGIDDRKFKPSGKSSIQTYLEYISVGHSVVFVHNTYTKRKDVQFARKRFDETHWCLCPNANLYIENRLPDIDMLISEGASICIGTDSLASNHQLCVLSELWTIKQHFPHIDWELLIEWGTISGACALQMQIDIGLIRVGTTPGIIHLIGLDQPGIKPSVKRII